VPSAFCAVYGLKPTWGAVSVDGVWPLARTLDHVGPMARTPADLALVLGSGPPVALLEGTTVVICPDLHHAPMTTDIERVFVDAVSTLERLGAHVVQRPLPHADRIDEVFRVVQLVEAARVHGEAGLYPQRAGDYGKDVLTRLEHAAAVHPDEYVRASANRELIRSEFAHLLADGALLVTPVSGVPPVVVAEDRSPAGREFRAGVLPYAVPHDVVGIPSCAVRAGFDSGGLPVGIQIAAAQWRDEAVLGAAAAFHAATPEVQERWP
jgi:aspartyl-tRNA(Asn)/glutamyl-tRNA(Gln) amidotransferase subunit A